MEGIGVEEGGGGLRGSVIDGAMRHEFGGLLGFRSLIMPLWFSVPLCGDTGQGAVVVSGKVFHTPTSSGD